MREAAVIEAALRVRKAPAAAETTACENNFRADGSHFVSARRAVEGLMTSVCSHRVCHLAFNINTGEQHAYALLAIQHLLERGRIAVISYDIACKLNSKVMNLINDLRAQNPDVDIHVAPDAPYIIVGPLHVNCHVARCQHRFSYVYLEGAGRPCGEMVESFNAFVNVVKSGSKYMGGTNYLLSTDLKIQVNNSDQRSKISQRLVSHMQHATKAEKAARSGLGLIERELKQVRFQSVVFRRLHLSSC